MGDSTVSTTRRREATRQRLLDAAAQVFAEVGLDAASVEAVCERAGYTRGAFYSNFETKEELFLELAGRVARDRVAAVRARVGELEHAPAPPGADAFSIVQEVLDVSNDDRFGVLLMSEIRIHALRNRSIADAYLAQETEMIASVAQIIDDIVRARRLTLRVPAEEAARLMLMAWEGASVRAVMAGLDYEELCRRTSVQIGRLAQLIIDAPAR
ncbi:MULTISPECIES: TetR/AcrR family transcriptional regulator [Bacteria]